MDDIMAEHKSPKARRGREPAGAQTAINAVIKERLKALGWSTRVPMFADRRERGLARWRLEYRKNRVGLEVSFNHVEAMAWKLIRLNVGIESIEVDPAARIDVGVAVFATERLKN